MNIKYKISGYNPWSFGRAILTFVVCLCFTTGGLFGQPSGIQGNNYVIVIHGGAGVMSPGVFTPEKEVLYHRSLESALKIGKMILERGGSSLDAVEAVIRCMEDDTLFNAGKGAVFTWEGKNELDACIIEGATQNAGSVAGVDRIKNPISAARAVMEKSPHVLMIGNGAEAFAEQSGLEMVDSNYFFTRSRFEALQTYKTKKEESLHKRGTVGCVAMDKQGHVAAGTSTDGMTGKQFGRVGDTPIIGAGTYADDRICAISCTGHGEYFMRFMVAKDIASLMEYKGMSLEEASSYVIEQKLVSLGGEGGMIGIDPRGNVVMKFNTPGMFRGYCTGENLETFIFK